MGNRLIEFCKWAGSLTEQAAKLVTLSEQEAADALLMDHLKLLSGRLKHPEVRILILGPLKSGKSTFMNVVCEHPSISQVNPLPAYPCTVEVRDIERDNLLRPRERENCTFYRDGLPMEPVPLARGLEHLNELLDDYIERPGSASASRYNKVVQRINLLPHPDMPEENRYIVLIDSPGLFFSNKVYTEDVHKEFAEADVIIFVVRQEQLFFESVNEYLKKFTAEAVHRRGFILVNIAVPSDKQLANFEHQEYKKKLDTYFRRHIATPELNQELINDDRISIRFANLYLAAAALLEKNPAYTEAYQGSETERSLDSIHKYLRTKLVDEKIRDISKKFEDTIRQGQTYLTNQSKEVEKHIFALQQSIAVTEKDIREKSAVKAGLNAKIEALTANIAQNRRRLSVVQEDTNLDTLPVQGDPDLLITQLHSGFGALPITSNHSLTETDLRDIIEKSYTKWQSGAHGTRTLKNLIQMIWKEEVSHDDLSISQYYHKLFTSTYKDCVIKLRTVFKDDLLRLAASNADTEDLINSAISHDLAKGEPKLLFFKPRGFWIWRKSPETMWGESGENIVDEDYEDILSFELDRFVGQILQDWQLSELFSKERLQETAKEILRKNLIVQLRILVEKQIQEQEKVLADLQRDIQKVESEIQEWMTTKQRQTSENERLNNHRTDIESRKTKLSELLSDYKKHVFNFTVV